MNLAPRLLSSAAACLTLFLAAPLCSIAADPTARSTTQSSGAISGRVQNVATGQYLNNARVTVKGTELVAFTDQTGSYRLTGVPSGPNVLEAFFTGLDPLQLPVTIRAGDIVDQDISLTNSARYGTDASGTVKLDSFVVATARETDSAAIAINEQRFAPNIKNIVSADALGDVMDGNVGEFLKFMPGITAEYDRESGGSVASVSVRGFPTAQAVVSGDGLQMANTGNPQGSSRVFQFTQVSINNISRLEVTKVPTPSTPADSMAGSIDMVSKSAFERKNAQLRYSVGLSGNHRTASFRKVPHTTDESVYKVLPSFTFDYTLPVSKTFGLVVTGQSQNRFIEMEWVPRGFSATATGVTGASISRPTCNPSSSTASRAPIPASPSASKPIGAPRPTASSRSTSSAAASSPTAPTPQSRSRPAPTACPLPPPACHSPSATTSRPVPPAAAPSPSATAAPASANNSTLKPSACATASTTATGASSPPSANRVPPADIKTRSTAASVPSSSSTASPSV